MKQYFRPILLVGDGDGGGGLHPPGGEGSAVGPINQNADNVLNPERALTIDDVFETQSFDVQEIDLSEVAGFASAVDSGVEVPTIEIPTVDIPLG